MPENSEEPSQEWFTHELPKQHAAIRLERAFSAGEMNLIRRGVVPRQMEDKWRILWSNDSLFFHRSWTGFCIYAVRFASAGDGCRIVDAKANRDPEQYGETSEERDANLIAYLIDVLLLHNDRPSPLGKGEKGALQTWSFIGRATFGEHPGDDSAE